MIIDGFVTNDIQQLDNELNTGVFSTYSTEKKASIRRFFLGENEPVNLLLQEKMMYDKRRNDGVDMFHFIMAELRLARLQNDLPLSWSDNIMFAFEKVKTMVVDGQWKTARGLCDEVLVDGVIVTQSFKDRIVSTIENYIAQNY
jgi:hypothetical protein